MEEEPCSLLDDGCSPLLEVDGDDGRPLELDETLELIELLESEDEGSELLVL